MPFAKDGLVFLRRGHATEGADAGAGKHQGQHSNIRGAEDDSTLQGGPPSEILRPFQQA